MSLEARPAVVPALDESFRPAVLVNRAFRDAVKASRKGVPLKIGLERGDGSVSVYETECFPAGHPSAKENLTYAERLVKTLLWQKGGRKVVVGGPREVGEYIQQAYTPQGARVFDANLMSTVYQKPFVVEVTTPDKVPPERDEAFPLGRHLEGCRIGFDLGANDRKVSAVIDGETVFSEETVWDPKNQSNPRFHYHEILSALHRAAARLPRVDAIGGSSAGIYVNNRVMVASLFRGIPREAFEREVRDMFLRMKREWNVPFDVVNDGEVTALAGSMSLKTNRVLGIALGSSEAGGYVNGDGNITCWLNELAFVPVDFQPDAPVDEWSRDIGCGVQYFSQEAVVRLAPRAGIHPDDKRTAAEKLKLVQELMARNDERAARIFETIGCYLGYGIAYYADFYDIGCVLILGRVTSGEGGQIILSKAGEVLKKEFPDLAARIRIQLPDEASRRVGQAIAAASLPRMEREK